MSRCKVPVVVGDMALLPNVRSIVVNMAESLPGLCFLESHVYGSYFE